MLGQRRATFLGTSLLGTRLFEILQSRRLSFLHALGRFVDGGVNVVGMPLVVQQLLVLRLLPERFLLVLRERLPSRGSGAAELVLVDVALRSLRAGVKVGAEDDERIARTRNVTALHGLLRLWQQFGNERLRVYRSRCARTRRSQRGDCRARRRARTRVGQCRRFPVFF